MGKKKRQQNPSTPVSDSSEEVDAVDSEKSAETIIAAKPNCSHFGRAVDPPCISKIIKSSDFSKFSCSVCEKKGNTSKSEDSWLCLQCGVTVCSLDHSLEHHNTPHSDSHALTFNLIQHKLWCHICKVELPESISKKIKTCIANIKMMTVEKAVREPSNNEDMPPPLVEITEEPDVPPLTAIRIKKESPVNKVPPRVKGLMNLGNTCFFNSVLQCLARTPNLVETLRILESEEQKISVTLKNGHTLEGVLEKSGDPLGSCLSDTLETLCVAGPSANPMKLLTLLRKKCPQFLGFQQHDSHELLRHLLDNVRLSDHKRYRTLMLNEMGLSKKVNPLQVSEEIQKKLKALDNEVVERVTLVPEQVFKGSLVSTLECLTCHSKSHCVESFLDLSLPILADKPQPPCIARRKNNSSPELFEEKSTPAEMSKRQLKKEKKIKKKWRKQQGVKMSGLEENSQETPSPENDPSDRGDSDADIEDNEEVDKRHESGYSSEKAQSDSGGSCVSGTCGEDSARTSPVVEGALPICEGYPLVKDLPRWLQTRTEQGWTLNAERMEKVTYQMEHGYEEMEDIVVLPTFQTSKRVLPDNALVQNKLCVNKLVLSQLGQSKPRVSIRDPEDIMAAGGDWKAFLPRNGTVPINAESSVKNKNCNTEENNETKIGDTISESVQPSQNCANERNANDEIVKVTKAVEKILSSLSVFQPREEIVRQETETNKQVENECDNRKGTVVEEAMDINEDNPVAKCDSSYNINTLYNSTECLVSNETFKESDTENQIQIEPLLNFFSGDGKNQMGKGVDLNGEKTDDVSEKNGNVPAKAEDKKDNNDDNLNSDWSTFQRKEYQCEEGECSVQSCLSQFISIEIMNGSNKVGCSACTARHNKGKPDAKTIYTNAFKQLLIKEAPQVLILHLKRFQVQMYSFKKLSKHVSFPLILDLAPFCVQELQKQEEGNLLYSLYGIVEHSGTLNGGHYVAYIKVEGEEKELCRWFCISDSHVHEVTEQRVLGSQAYLLFYKRTVKSL